MKNILNKISIVAAAAVLLTACNNNQVEEKQVIAAVEKPVLTTLPVVAATQYKKGDHVPSELVCMVNDAYMGKKQLEVPFDGKTYYGCCDMCQKRIPEDANVRKALDPLTLKEVDKATAHIVLIGDNGEVAYFENKKNHEAFIKNNR